MKLQMPVALATGTLLLLAGCSYFAPPSEEAVSPESSPTTISAEPTQAPASGGNPAEPLFPANSAPSPDAGSPRNLIGVQILPEGLAVSTQQTVAGKVSFQIINTSVQAQKVFVIKSNVPLEQIPVKDDALDFDNPNIQLLGQLDNGLLSAYGESIINCTLEPGQYLLIAYAPGSIRVAKVAVISVQRPEA
ncbi:MAG TPA: hypothetical protein V6D07_15130 [Trichocoleus sp.]